jgi:hypothetical protein
MFRKITKPSLFLFLSIFILSNQVKALPPKACVDLDLDGYGLSVSKACPKTGIDCDDNNTLINPGAVETCDGKDNNCNGQLDEGNVCCSSNIGKPCSVGTGECKGVGTIQCNGSCNAVQGVPGPEICNNLDDNCDGNIDEGNVCCVPSVNQSCYIGKGECLSTGVVECDGKCNAEIKSPISEICGDGKDNDCDGVIDNGCVILNSLRIKDGFKGSYDRTTQTSYIANNFDYVILVEAGASRTTGLKAANPNIKILRYSKFAGSHGPETRAPSGDFFWSLATGTPNLLWPTSSGFMKQAQFGWYFIDIVHNDMSALASREGAFLTSDGKYDGLFLDSAGIQTPDLVTSYPINYNDAEYEQAAYNLMSKIRLAIPNTILIPNGYAGAQSVGLRGMGFLANSDGIMFEGYATKVSGKMFDLNRYRQQITDFCEASKNNKRTVATDYLQSEVDYQRRIFILSTYILSAGNESFIYTIPPSSLGSDVAKFPEHDIELGVPSSECFIEDSGVFSRSFSNGLSVYVNMSGQEKTIDFGRTNTKLVLSGNMLWNGTATISWEPNNKLFTIKNGESIIVR